MGPFLNFKRELRQRRTLPFSRMLPIQLPLLVLPVITYWAYCSMSQLFFLLRLNLYPWQNFGIVCVPYLPLETKNIGAQSPSQPCPTHDGFVRIYFCTYSITRYSSDRFRSTQSVTKNAGISFQMSPVFWRMNVSKIGSANRNLYRGF